MIVVGAAVWTVVMSWAAIWRHDQFLSHRFDLGNMVQAVWSTTQGRPLEMTDAATGEQITRLGAHVDPILVLIAPLWWIYPGPDLLLVLQAGVLSTGVYPAFRLALEHTSSPFVAGLVGVWYLVFPWIVWTAFDDFHPVTLAIPLLLYAIWFLDNDRFVLFALFAGLAMLAGELIGLTVAGLGVWYAIERRSFRAGGLIALFGVGWTTICVAAIVPAFSGGESSRYYERFDSVGGSPTGVLRTLFTDPGEILQAVTGGNDVRYVLWLLVPTAFLALLAPVLLVAALPQLGVNLVAEWSTAALPMFHYVSALVPIVIAATVMALGRLSARLQVVGAGAATAASAVILAAYPPQPGAQAFVFPEEYAVEHRAALGEAIALVPDGLPVSATNRVGAHLSDRRVVQLFPELREVQWAVIDTRNPWLPGVGEGAKTNVFMRSVKRLANDTEWKLRFDRAGVRVYQRVG